MNAPKPKPVTICETLGRLKHSCSSMFSELFRGLDYTLEPAFAEQIEWLRPPSRMFGLMKKTFCIHSSW